MRPQPCPSSYGYFSVVIGSITVGTAFQGMIAGDNRAERTDNNLIGKGYFPTSDIGIIAYIYIIPDGKKLRIIDIHIGTDPQPTAAALHGPGREKSPDIQGSTVRREYIQQVVQKRIERSVQFLTHLSPQRLPCDPVLFFVRKNPSDLKVRGLVNLLENTIDILAQKTYRRKNQA